MDFPFSASQTKVANVRANQFMGLWAERCMLANHQFIDGGRLWSLRVRLSLRAHFQICKAHSKSSFVPANMHFSTFSKSQSTHKCTLTALSLVFHPKVRRFSSLQSDPWKYLQNHALAPCSFGVGLSRLPSEPSSLSPSLFFRSLSCISKQHATDRPADRQ